MIHLLTHLIIALPLSQFLCSKGKYRRNEKHYIYSLKLSFFFSQKLYLTIKVVLRLLWHLRFTMIKTQPRKLASSTGRVSRSLRNQRHVLRNLSESLYEYEIAAAQPITNMKTFKKCTENYMFKSVRVNLTTLLTLHYHSLSLFLSHEEVWSFVVSAPVS